MLFSFPDAPHSVEVIPSVSYGSAPAIGTDRDWDIDLCLDLLVPSPRPAEPCPAVVYIHGGGWELGDKAAGMYPWVSPLMAAHGFVAVNVGYRLSWMAPHPAQINDVQAAIGWLRANASTYGIDSDRIGVWGDSAGGHLAALLGVDEPGTVQAVVARCPPTNFVPPEGYDIDGDELLVRLVGRPEHRRPDVFRELSPIARVHDKVPPFLVVQGTDDELVPYAQTEAFVRALRDHGTDVTFDIIEGGHHDLRVETGPRQDDKHDEARGRQALEFFQRHLGR